MAVESGSEVLAWQMLVKKLRTAKAEEFLGTVMLIWAAYRERLGWPQDF